MCRERKDCWLCAAVFAADSPDEGSQTGCASLFLVALWVAAVTVCGWWAGL